MKKGKTKNNKVKKGDVCMQSTINGLTALKERASQRRLSFPNQKDEKDTEIENEFFDEMKEKVYEQIAEEREWN